MKDNRFILGILAVVSVMFLLTSCSSDINKINDNGKVSITIVSPNETTEENLVSDNIEKNLTANNPVPLVSKTKAASDSIVKMIDVTESGDSCIVEIKGQKVVIDKGRSETVDGITVHVLDVVPVHSQLADQDMCQVIISMR